MELIKTNVGKYLLSDTLIENDGHIGIPVHASLLFCNDRFTVKKNSGGTPVMIYVMGTQIERVGQGDDIEIINGMLDRGFAVVVLDYLGSEKAKRPALDWSVQKIRQKIASSELLLGSTAAFGEGRYPETLVVPAGYDVSYGNVFFELDKHGADGTLEKIAEIWNNDFRGTKGERLVRWVDASGARKPTQPGHDNSMPVWLDEGGNECESGEYVRVKHTLVRDVTDCVRPDGSFIELKLYMHLIYPVNPEKPVPVMCLSSSAEGLCRGSATADRPHLNGFTFDGYATVLFDYGYTPMARDDHYGYFDGFPMKGYITGNNITYAVNHYNDKKIFPAAMRYIRYLAASDGRFCFNTDAIGVFGNSKGAWMTFLGEKSPELMDPPRMFAGHHGESRYENGKCESVGVINGGEEQPWLTYEGKKLESTASLIYSSTGGTDNFVTEGHAPLFISCNRKDSSCYSTSNAFVNVCRTHNVPALWVDIPLPHTLTYDKDLVYGNDAYDAFFDFSGYYLRGDAIKALAAKVNEWSDEKSITVRFSGAALQDSENVKAMRVTCGEREIEGEWTSAYGNVEWTFTPTVPFSSGEYTLTVPAGFKGDNGKPSKAPFVFDFSVKGRTVTAVDFQHGKATVVRNSALPVCKLMLDVTNDGVNRIGAYTSCGKLAASVNTSGKGRYALDISELAASLAEGEKIELDIRTERPASDVTVYNETLRGTLGSVEVGKLAHTEFSSAPDGSVALCVKGYDTVKTYPTEEFYVYQQASIVCPGIVKHGAIEPSDMGRKFHISLEIFDTVSRYVRISLNNCTSRALSIADYRASTYNLKTTAGKWQRFEFDYTVYEPMYKGIQLSEKVLSVLCYGRGNVETPIYFRDVKAVEKVSCVELGELYLLECEEENVLPDGASVIECPESPWLKKK